MQHHDYLSFERHVLQDNIVLCDTKSGILLGAGAVVIVWCLDQLEKVTGAIQQMLYSLAIIAIMFTMYFAWNVIKPRIRRCDDHVFWESKLFQGSESEFTARIQSTESALFATDMIRHLHILADVCCRKFANLQRAAIAAKAAFLFVILAVCAPLLLPIVQRLLDSSQPINPVVIQKFHHVPMDVNLVLLFSALAYLIFKHFICDFPLQSAYQLENKGKYGHPGGLVHASIHVIGTLPAFLLLRPSFGLAAGILAGEWLLHYHIDWAKEQALKRFNWTVSNRRYWSALGVDQMLHYLTYLGIGILLLTMA